MIVRLLGEGQYRVDDSLLARLNELDDEIEKAIEANDERGLWAGLQALADTVRQSGQKLGDDELYPSDVVIPPEDFSLEEARQVLTGKGLIPDTLPSS
jgi:hypothetical protein